jgi:hypothetical protein
MTQASKSKPLSVHQHKPKSGKRNEAKGLALQLIAVARASAQANANAKANANANANRNTSKDKSSCELGPSATAAAESAENEALTGPNAQLFERMNSILKGTHGLTQAEADALCKLVQGCVKDAGYSPSGPVNPMIINTINRICSNVEVLVDSFVKRVFCWNEQRRRILWCVVKCLCIYFALRGITSRISLPNISACIESFTQKSAEMMFESTRLLRSVPEMRGRIWKEYAKLSKTSDDATKKAHQMDISADARVKSTILPGSVKDALEPNASTYMDEILRQWSTNK